MLILGIDTATPIAAVGVVRDDEVLAEVFEQSATGHAARLPFLVEQALTVAACELADIDAFAVSVGPGSFTGLRVGLSFAKGVAFATGARIAGVSTLEALAAVALGSSELVAVVLDARRGETYMALFGKPAARPERLTSDESLAPDDAARQIRARARETASCMVVGDAAERYPESFAALRDRRFTFAPFTEIHPLGSAVARLGARRLARGESDRLESIVPVYVRPSAAEAKLRDATLTTENTVS